MRLVPIGDDSTWIQAKDLVCDCNSSTLVLITLEKDLQMSLTVRVIALPEQFQKPEQCFAAGFTLVKWPEPLHLYQKHVDIYDSRVCSNVFRSMNSKKIEDSICLKVDFSELGCQLDDARILFCKNTFMGFMEKGLSQKLFRQIAFSFWRCKKPTDFLKNYMERENSKTYRIDHVTLSTISKSGKLFNTFYNVFITKVLFLLLAF